MYDLEKRSVRSQALSARIWAVSGDLTALGLFI
jgi:hypothetical protein